MRDSTRRASIILGAFMIFVLVAGAIVPLFQQNIVATAPPIEPTTAPTPTFPPPIENAESLSFDQVYLHPTGLFAIAQPEGWSPSPPISETTRAAVTMVNSEAISVIEASVEQPATPVASLDELSRRYDEAYLDASWARYGDWSETARRVEADKLLIDFNLTLNRQTYIARQMSWTDGDWTYSIRVVMPSNASEPLVVILNRLVDSLQPFKVFAGQPVSWQMYYDPVHYHAIRYPDDWTVADSAPGRPTSIVAPDGARLRVEAQPGAVDDEAAARAWVERARPGATILSAAPVERNGVSGFSVAYAFTTVDGEPWSGLAVLLNGAEQTHVANLQFPGNNVDLNAADEQTPESADATAEATAEATDEAADEAAVSPGMEQRAAELSTVMESFVILEPLNLANPDATPTPLPQVPTPAPEEATAEAATDEAEVTDDEATAEATEAEE